jgi:hypothetical protein
MKNPSFDPDLDAQLADAMAAADNEDMDLASAIAPDGDMPAISIGASQFTRGRQGVNGFCIPPLWVVKDIATARAHHAVLLVAVVLQRMRVRKTTTVPITSAVWAEIASPARYERETILKHLRLIPSVLKLEERPRGYTRYQAVLGDGWTAS